MEALDRLQELYVDEMAYDEIEVWRRSLRAEVSAVLLEIKNSMLRTRFRGTAYELGFSSTEAAFTAAED